jgi:hypothetical protein
MRLFTVSAVLFLSSLAVAQTPIHGYSGYGYGPYIPLITTPEISLQSRATGPTVGATNATAGLQAGAQNSTLEMVTGNVSAEYTQPVWYSGGTTPEISRPSVQLSHGGPAAEMMMHMEHRMRGHEREAAAKEWTYFGETEVSSATEASAAAKTAKRATRTITNQDIDQENQKTGTVKYDGKTETIK